MKKLVALLLVLVLVIGCLSAMAECDLSFVRSNSSVFEIDVRSDEGYAFINTKFTAKDRMFAHKYESDNYYSHVYNDIIVLDYFKTSSYPVWRMWVEYVGTKHIYANSVSFIVDGKKYTFSGISDSDSFGSKSNGDAMETLMIKFGTDNIDFVIALEKYVNKLSENQSDSVQAILDNCDITMILHGS